jgi:hypothetical protein
MASKETSIALLRAAGWQALMGIYALFVLNELLPVIFGSGENASWDWSFIFVTLRIIIVPLAALLCLGAPSAATALALRSTAQLCMDCRRRSSSCCHPKLVPLFNESGKLVPTSHRWGHRHQRARLLPGFFYRNRSSPVMAAGLMQSNLG